QYLSNDQEYRLPTVGVIENNVEHFTKTIPTGNNMQIVIPHDAWTHKPEIGSEIAAYTRNGILVGSAKYSNPTTVLTLWGDDVTTASIDGLLIDEPITFKVWDKAGIRDFKIENWAEGTNAYQIDAIHVAAAIEIEDFIETTNLFDAIPNPSHTKTNISFFVAETSKVNISVYSVVGELVEVIANSVYQTGTHQLEMEVSNLEVGSYFYTMKTGEYEKTKKIIILKN
nr:T9SS type A sorting domain-containing protein [Candidatus Neomarinimicrobiota bacterium]